MRHLNIVNWNMWSVLVWEAMHKWLTFAKRLTKYFNSDLTSDNGTRTARQHIPMHSLLRNATVTQNIVKGDKWSNSICLFSWTNKLEDTETELRKQELIWPGLLRRVTVRSLGLMSSYCRWSSFLSASGNVQGNAQDWRRQEIKWATRWQKNECWGCTPEKELNSWPDFRSLKVLKHSCPEV